jgi:hypothetical protein
MKKILATCLLTSSLFTAVNAQDKYDNLTEDYLTTKASLNVRTTLAKDPKTSSTVLKILANDSNDLVRKYAKENLK